MATNNHQAALTDKELSPFVAPLGVFSHDITQQGPTQPNSPKLRRTTNPC